MKKRYIKPTVELLGIEEEKPLLVNSLINTNGALFLDSRSSNTAFAEDEDISEDVY